MTSKMVTMTVVMAPTMVMMTLAIAEIMALMPRPMAENTEPYENQLEIRSRGSGTVDIPW